MYNLLKVELYKLKKFSFGYVAVFLLFVAGYIFGDNRIGNRVFEMADNTDLVFSCVISDTSFVFFISIIMAVFIGKDFSNRTICHEIKLGYSRFQILLSRMVVVCAFAVLLHVIYVLSAVFGFSVVRGFDTSVLCVRNALWLLIVLIQLVAVISGVVLLSFLAKRLSEAIVLSTMYSFICCNILRNFMSSKIFTLSCFCFVQSSSTENLVYATISALVTMFIFLTIAIFSFNKAEVK
ncbi:MAG: ABC transporter permease [Lachnospiraceae bacterium]|nr:ABC transporter permease [Lachnospiraceae bacterium]